MSLYKPVGISLLPEKIAKIDARAEELGLSRSKYLQALVDADLDAGLLDCTIDARGGQPVVKVKEDVSVVVLTREAVASLSVDIIVGAIKTLAVTVPELQMKTLAGNVRNAAEKIVQRT